MLDARFLHSYFCQRLLTLQRGLSAIADLLVKTKKKETLCQAQAKKRSRPVRINMSVTAQDLWGLVAVQW